MTKLIIPELAEGFHEDPLREALRVSYMFNLSRKQHSYSLEEVNTILKYIEDKLAEALIKREQLNSSTHWQDVAADALREDRVDDAVGIIRDNSPPCQSCGYPLDKREEVLNTDVEDHPLRQDYKFVCRELFRLSEGPARKESDAEVGDVGVTWGRNLINTNVPVLGDTVGEVLERNKNVNQPDHWALTTKWQRIGMIDSSKRRSLWIRNVHDFDGKNLAIDLCSGREGDDEFVRINRTDLPEKVFVALENVLSRARAVATGDMVF